MSPVALCWIVWAASWAINSKSSAPRLRAQDDIWTESERFCSEADPQLWRDRLRDAPAPSEGPRGNSTPAVCACAGATVRLRPSASQEGRRGLASQSRRCRAARERNPSLASECAPGAPALVWADEWRRLA